MKYRKKLLAIKKGGVAIASDILQFKTEENYSDRERAKLLMVALDTHAEAIGTEVIMCLQDYPELLTIQPKHFTKYVARFLHAEDDVLAAKARNLAIQYNRSLVLDDTYMRLLNLYQCPLTKATEELEAYKYTQENILIPLQRLVVFRIHTAKPGEPLECFADAAGGALDQFGRNFSLSMIAKIGVQTNASAEVYRYGVLNRGLGPLLIHESSAKREVARKLLDWCSAKGSLRYSQYGWLVENVQMYRRHTARSGECSNQQCKYEPCRIALELTEELCPAVLSSISKWGPGLCDECAKAAIAYLSYFAYEPAREESGKAADIVVSLLSRNDYRLEVLRDVLIHKTSRHSEHYVGQKYIYCVAERKPPGWERFLQEVATTPISWCNITKNQDELLDGRMQAFNLLPETTPEQKERFCLQLLRECRLRRSTYSDHPTQFAVEQAVEQELFGESMWWESNTSDDTLWEIVANIGHFPRTTKFIEYLNRSPLLSLPAIVRDSRCSDKSKGVLFSHMLTNVDDSLVTLAILGFLDMKYELDHESLQSLKNSDWSMTPLADAVAASFDLLSDGEPAARERAHVILRLANRDPLENIDEMERAIRTNLSTAIGSSRLAVLSKILGAASTQKVRDIFWCAFERILRKPEGLSKYDVRSLQDFELANTRLEKKAALLQEYLESDSQFFWRDLSVVSEDTWNAEPVVRILGLARNQLSSQNLEARNRAVRMLCASGNSPLETNCYAEHIARICLQGRTYIEFDVFDKYGPSSYFDKKKTPQQHVLDLCLSSSQARANLYSAFLTNYSHDATWTEKLQIHHWIATIGISPSDEKMLAEFYVAVDLPRRAAGLGGVALKPLLELLNNILNPPDTFRFTDLVRNLDLLEILSTEYSKIAGPIFDTFVSNQLNELESSRSWLARKTGEVGDIKLHFGWGNDLSNDLTELEVYLQSAGPLLSRSTLTTMAEFEDITIWQPVQGDTSHPEAPTDRYVLLEHRWIDFSFASVRSLASDVLKELAE